MFFKKLGCLWGLSALLLLQNANAQQGAGIVEGKLVNATNAAIIPAKVELDVIGLGGGMSVVKSAVSDRFGKFRIDALPTDMPLMIRANYKSVNYHGRVNFDPSGKASTTIEVFEPTTSMKGIQLDGPAIGFQLVGDQLRCIESYSFKNETNPPQTFMSLDGNFRFSKAPGILEPPRVSVVGPGASMPLTQSPLESPDGESYYSLYPLRPGVTTFEVEQVVPYSNHQYTYHKKFYQDVTSFQMGIIPQDVVVSGSGLTKVQSDTQKNFVVYAGGPVKAGTEVVWTFSGGTPVVENQQPSAESGDSGAKIKPVPPRSAREALVIGPLLLLGFIVVLWYASNRVPATLPTAQDPRVKELRSRRDLLLNELATLDRRYESQELDRRQYVRQREQGKSQLRRIAMLLRK